MDLSLLEKCRLCQAKPGAFQLKTDVDFTNKIFECTRIKVNDDLLSLMPSSICSDCRIKVSIMYDFVKEVHRIDEYLRKTVLNVEESDDNPSNNSYAESVNEHKCTKCPASYTSYAVLKTHLKSHSTYKNVKMNKLKGTLRRKPPDLISPILSKTDNESKCKTLTEKTNFSNNVVADENSSEEQSEVNTVLELKFKNEKPVKTEFECEICNKQFRNKNNLRAHKNTHKISFDCPIEDCEKVCSTAYALKIQKYVHESNRPYHLCVTCGKGFNTKNSLTCHEKTHSEVKGYVCTLCNIGFSVRSNLRAHEKKYHEGVRYYCSQCTKEFITKSSLNRHEKIHTGIKEFKCDLCSAAFYTNKELLKHKRYHQGIRRHKCDECYKSFYERHHLIIHLRSHTGERPYVCKVAGCDKSYVDSQKLKRHHAAKHSN